LFGEPRLLRNERWLNEYEIEKNRVVPVSNTLSSLKRGYKYNGRTNCFAKLLTKYAPPAFSWNTLLKTLLN
jgi:hypothetical protein